MKFPKVLVISNNCLARNNANGRTLGNLIEVFPKECVSQFFIKPGIPDADICDNYFCITDNEILNCFFRSKNKNKTILKKVDKSNELNIRKTAFNSLARESIWSISKWKKKELFDWIKEFSPQVVLLQIGDTGFLIRLAREISRKFNIPIVIFNTESYYFMRKNYLSDGGIIEQLAFKFFMLQLKRSYRKIIPYVSYIIHHCEPLENLYKTKFSIDSTTIYTSTNMKLSTSNKKNVNTPIISYLGNLGLDRIQSLIEIANVAHSINKYVYLDVYGQIICEEDKKKLMSCNAIRYHGVVSYQKVQNVIQESDILVHAESFKKFYLETMSYAFSTKIADCLASGKCFVLYAPENYACTKYLKSNSASFVATSHNELVSILKTVVLEPSSRCFYTTTALNIVNKNHNIKKNQEKFLNIIMGVTKLKG